MARWQTSLGRRRPRSRSIGLASALVIVGGGGAAVPNPLWVGFEQARPNADGLTGFGLDDVHRVTNGVLADLIVGPADSFSRSVASPSSTRASASTCAMSAACSSASSRVVALGIVVLVVAARRRGDRAWLWRSSRTGTGALAIVVRRRGACSRSSSTPLFELFHQIFFAGGSYTFDPRHERLVQLFPEQFWSETAIVLAVAILLLPSPCRWSRRTAVADVARRGRPPLRAATRGTCTNA